MVGNLLELIVDGQKKTHLFIQYINRNNPMFTICFFINRMSRLSYNSGKSSPMPKLYGIPL